MATRVVIASQAGVKLDSNVFSGGGTPDTECIQAILDTAKESPLYFVMDGAALVSGIVVHPNTTIYCPDRNCGFFQMANSNRPLVTNANWSHADRKDKDITLDGGTYNQNCREQVHDLSSIGQAPLRSSCDATDLEMDWVMNMVFIGVERLTLKNLAIRDQRTFGLLCRNFKHVLMEDIAIELPNKMHAENQDGLHFWGPGQYLTLRHIHGCSGDDFIALAPDEHDFTSSITDVLIDGVVLEDADQAIRMLVRDKGTLDRVVVRNVVGTYRSFGFFINPWFPDEDFRGHFGSITIDTVDLRALDPEYTYTNNMLFRIGGKVDALTLRNIRWIDPKASNILMQIGASRNTVIDGKDEFDQTKIRSLEIDGLKIHRSDCFDDEYITVTGEVKLLTLRNTEVLTDGEKATGTLVKTKEMGTVHTLLLDGGIVEGMEKLTDGDGFVRIIGKESIYN